MKRLVFTPAARNDLTSIWLYSARTWGVEQADEYTDAIEAVCISVARSLGLGRAVIGRGDYRKRAVRSHVLYFRDLPDQIQIIRILHTRQDPDIQLHE